MLPKLYPKLWPFKARHPLDRTARLFLRQVMTLQRKSIMSHLPTLSFACPTPTWKNALKAYLNPLPTSLGPMENETYRRGLPHSSLSHSEEPTADAPLPCSLIRTAPELELPYSLIASELSAPDDSFQSTCLRGTTRTENESEPLSLEAIQQSFSTIAEKLEEHS